MSDTVLQPKGDMEGTEESLKSVRKGDCGAAFGAADFVVLSDVVPGVLLDIRYYSSYNFVGERIDGYEAPCALLTGQAAAALKEAAAWFLQQGFRFKIYDAYRPQRAVDHFLRWAENSADTRMKADFYPKIDKSQIVPRGYILKKSGHSRGSTVDLTLVDAATGQDVDMGGPFDLFDELSHPSCTNGVTARQTENRMLLRRGMTAHGFMPIEEEWWHFTLKDEPFPHTYFDFPVSPLSV